MKKLLAGIFLACAPLAAFGASAKPSPFHRTVVLPAGTQLSVRLNQPLDTRRDRPGTRFTAHLSAPVVQKGDTILPRGAVCHGHLDESKPSGRLRGRAVMSLALDSVEFQGKAYPVSTSDATRVSKDHKKRNLLLIGGIASAGAAIGALAAGGMGALIGGGAGAGAGAAGATATGKRNVRLPSETLVTVALRQPVTLRE